MKILIAGLGLIGGSAAKALRRAGHACDAFDRAEVVAQAVREGTAGEGKELSAYDVVFVALPPDAAMRFIDGGAFRSGAVVADFCGVKGAVAACVRSRPRAFRYVGCHPMAGKEVSGYANSCADLFDGASMIVVREEDTDPAAVALLEGLYGEMGFGSIVHCSAAEHDRRIAYTSQLAHIVSNSYCKSGTIEEKEGFCAGSFADMTRVGKLDVNLWTQLFMLNAEALDAELTNLIGNLSAFKKALDDKDEESLRALLAEGNAIKVESLKREKTE